MDILSRYHLSDIQQGILFENLKDPASSFYIVQMIFDFVKTVHLPAFVRAFELLIERHDPLRSAIIHDGGKYVQAVFNEVKLPYFFNDYSKVELSDKKKIFNLFLQKDLLHPFDLAQPPLMRLACFKFSEKDYKIVWTRHHILMDGASVEKLIRELFTIYQHSIKNRTLQLTPPPVYAEGLALYHHQESESEKRYWQVSLKNHGNSAFLPAELPENTAIKNTAHKTIYYEGNDYQKLLTFVRGTFFTPNVLMQAAWGIVLSHYSNKQNIVLGTVRAYPKEQVRNHLGLFINTLPICLDINFSKSIPGYLEEVRWHNQQLKKYVNVPLVKIREWCNLKADTPLYQCVIDYKARSLNAILRENFNTLGCHLSFHLNIPYPLVIEIINDEDCLEIKVHYDTQRFSSNYVDSLLLHFKAILKSLIHQLNNSLGELPTLTTHDLRAILDFNETSTAYPLDKTVHQLFEEQVKKAPFSAAVIFHEDILTYQALNEQANQLAHFLLTQGINNEKYVAICLKPTCEMIIAVLAVLKTGAAYIPIDPQYPEERIDYLLQNSEPAMVLTQSEQIELLHKISYRKNSTQCAIVNLDKNEWVTYKKSNLRLPLISNTRMYAIYTSGSTGYPKGVMVTHRSAVNMALACIEGLRVSAESRILQIASFSFDVSVAEWCMALLGGASLYLMDKAIFSPERMLQALRDNKITTIILAGSILSSLPQESLPDLKVIAVGGEPCSPFIIDFWSKNRLFLNVYGITETTVCSTMADNNTLQINPRIIGKPLANTTVFILNAHQQLLPIGVPGEIYIGGEGVAEGYLNNLELTHEKFMINPMIADKPNPNGRVYKTGDFGRWLPSGDIEYLGRMDDQIKIRGFRVELSEIDRTIEKHPAIKMAVTIVTSDGKLCTYVLNKNNTSLDLNALREFIRARLPYYMIPFSFVPLDKFPLTPNGKIDKKKLALLKAKDIFPNSQHNIPKPSGLTEKITAIISTLLGTYPIATDQNFLDMGFDSLSLITLCLQLSEKLNFKIDILELFTYSTVDMLVQHLNNRMTATTKRRNLVFGSEVRTPGSKKP